MSIRVISNSKRAVMYHGTSDIAFGPVYRSSGNPKSELQDIIDKLPSDPRDYDTRKLESIFTGYRVKNGELDKADYPEKLRLAEEELDL